ncbi:hemerythrin domain-containing protein [Paenibacillus sp. y28]|uniref:hemerythrin domain-containing protein n=1 Tax=Paenibacillus sp. y28 TaxID=3129110 RepID=UPI00301A04A7
MKPLLADTAVQAAVEPLRQHALCEALQQLKEEHVPLVQAAERLGRLAEGIGSGPDVEDWTLPLEALGREAAAFAEQLEPHLLREEAGLFPVLTLYMGRRAGPMEEMEQEQEHIRSALRRFHYALRQTEGTTADAGEAQAMADLVQEACMRFVKLAAKEERVLLPIAEQLLTADEKEQLMMTYFKLIC